MVLRTKHNVDRHLTGSAHEIALHTENEKPVEERMGTLCSNSSVVQTSVVTSMKDSSRSAYVRMFRTAYELALTPSMPLKHFDVLIKCQRQNGVRLIKDKQDGKAAREFIKYIAFAVVEKVSATISQAKFFSVLSDGSQPKKTGSEKEMILTLIERNGLPCYLTTSLLEMSEFGGSGAEVIKSGIDHVYLNEMKLSDDAFKTCLIGATSDGASVNTGKYSGVLTRLKEERPWLITIHCANHRIELAAKDSMNQSIMVDAQQFYLTNYFLLKNSGAIKAEVRKSAEALGITSYELPKIQGTRFIGHRQRGYQRFLHMMPALVMAYENSLTHTKKSADVKAKLSGLIKKLRDAKEILNVCAALDILEKSVPASMVFEGDGLMPHEISPNIEMTQMELQELLDYNVDDELPIDSNLRYFTSEATEQSVSYSHMYCRAAHELRKPCNREYIHVSIGEIKHFTDHVFKDVFRRLKGVAEPFINVLEVRFSDNNREIFDLMKWFDPKFWDGSADYGQNEISSLYEHFKIPLDNAGFEFFKVQKEWKHVKVFIKAHYLKDGSNMDGIKIWQNIITCRKAEYPNICMLASLIICLSGSNSSVERAFSVLTLILSDHRLALRHNTIRNLMLIKCNDRNWSVDEKEQIIHNALDAYLEKRRTTIIAE